MRRRRSARSWKSERRCLRAVDLSPVPRRFRGVAAVPHCPFRARTGGRATPASLRNRQSARQHNNSAPLGPQTCCADTAPPLAISSAAFTARSGPTGRAPAAQTSREGTSQKQKGHPKAASARSEESRLSLVIKDHPNPIDMINQLWVVEHRIGRQIDDNWQ